MIERLGFTDYEVIAINDGSEDGTAAVLARLESDLPQFRVITHPKNRGYGGALRSGFSAACKDLVFYTDGDAQYDVEELPLLLEKLADDVDVVNGYKVSRSDVWIRDVVGKLYRSAVHMLFKTPIRDIDCDFRLIRRRALEPIQLTMDSGAICLELVAQLTATEHALLRSVCTTTPVSTVGPNSSAPRHIIKTLLDDFRFGFNFDRCGGHMWRGKSEIRPRRALLRSHFSLIKSTSCSRYHTNFI